MIYKIRNNKKTKRTAYIFAVPSQQQAGRPTDLIYRVIQIISISLKGAKFSRVTLFRKHGKKGCFLCSSTIHSTKYGRAVFFEVIELCSKKEVVQFRRIWFLCTRKCGGRLVFPYLEVVPKSLLVVV